MLDFTTLLYKNIGMRIKELRNKNHLLQTAIYYIDTSILSKIENGKAIKSKNPYFLNSSQIKVLCDTFQITPSELIWGNEAEKKDFIKMIVIAILLNDEANAFHESSLTQWIEKEWDYSPAKQEQAKKNFAETERNFGFFVNSKNYSLYELLNPMFDENYEQLSNLILKQLIQDYNFSRHFFFHLINYTNNAEKSPDKLKKLLENFIINKGSYALFILDKKGIDYPEFVLAFNKYWKRVECEYLQFFEKNFFIGDDELLQKGLKDIQNIRMNEIITSSDFIDLNKKLSLLEEYTNEEAILSSLNIRFTLISALLTENSSYKQLSPDFLNSYSQIQACLLEQLKNYFPKAP